MINNYTFYIFIIIISLLILYFIQFNLFMNKHEDWEEYNKINYYWIPISICNQRFMIIEKRK